MEHASQPEAIWSPSTEDLRDSDMARLMREVGVDDYQQLWQWSVDDIGRFWRMMWDRYDIQADGDPSCVLRDASMPGATWFPDVRLSFAEHVFRDKPGSAVAIRAWSEAGHQEDWTWDRLAEETRRIRAGLLGMGVVEGDRVAGFLPNVPETIAAFLAVASIGAIWSCCSPDFGSRTVLDRFAQIEPKVLLAVDSYQFNGTRFDRSETVAELSASLPTVEHTVVLGGEEWAEAFPETTAPLEFRRLAFDHPLWIVYSSGTTGLPKGIVHGHGGFLLEQYKVWPLHHDTSRDDVIFWYTTTGWVMWNIVVGALMTGSSVVIYDGSPAWPDLGVLWDVVESTRTTVFGTGAALIHACMKAGLEPAAGRDLSALRAISSSASPLAPEAYLWVKERLGPRVWLSSSSGGTDIAGGFVGGSPLVGVWPGEIPSRLLGVAVEAWNEDGEPVHDAVGELVVTQPMPSMPVMLWNDPDGERYRDAYYDMFPGVWRQGDWIRITDRGSAIIYGRSDSTINRGGVRMGTAEIYAAVLPVDAVADAVVVDVPAESGVGASTMILFVTSAGPELGDREFEEIRRRIRTDCSPRHVPDQIVVVPEIPRTLSNKALEVPIKKLLMGWAPERAASKDAMANPGAFDWFVDYARRAREEHHVGA